MAPKLNRNPDGTRACEFDGRTSLAKVGGTYHLFVRLNAASRGQRFVQRATSTDLKSWSTFERITLQGFRRRDQDALNLYFFAVVENPTLPNTMVALTSVVHSGMGCVGASFSANGLHWSAISPLLACPTDIVAPNVSAPSEIKRGHRGERATAHPAAGVLLLGSTKAKTPTT